MAQPIAPAARRSARSRSATSSNGRSLIRPATGSGQLGAHLAAGDGDAAALQLDQPVDRERHVGVVVADHDQIVAVVADRAGERAAQRAEALDEAAPDIAVACRGARARTACARPAPGRAGGRRRGTAASRVRCSVSSECSIAPITGPDGPAARTANSSGATGARLTEPWPTGGTTARSANAASSIGTPPQITCATAQLSRSSSSTMSARRPGAIWPRSNRPNARAAPQARRAVGRERRHARRDRLADREVDVAFLGDLERVAIVGAERQRRPGRARSAAARARRRPWRCCPRASARACPSLSFSRPSSKPVLSWSVRIAAAR